MRRKYATQGAVQPGPAFIEDAIGNKYDVAGNIIPQPEQAISDALTTARAETYNPYAEEIASAKKLMADQAYQNQNWGDWASDAGRNLYETGMSFLPTALGGRGEVGLTDIAKGVYESGKSAATLPGDVLTGKTKVFDPASGNLTDEVLGRGMDFTGFMTLGAGAIPAEANTLRMGMKGPSEPPKPTDMPEPSVEDMALKAAQDATGGDDAATAARMAREPVGPPPIGHNIPPAKTLLETFDEENLPGVIVSPKPGTGGFSFSTPDLIGMPVPPPMYNPIRNADVRPIARDAEKILNSQPFRNYAETQLGVTGFNVTPTIGTWMGNPEPSFIIQGGNLTPDNASTLARALGLGFQQDAAVITMHNPTVADGIPTMLIGTGNELTKAEVNRIMQAAKQQGLDFTITKDGRAARFSHFDGPETLPQFADKIMAVAEAAKMPELLGVKTQGDLINADQYINGLVPEASTGAGAGYGPGNPSDLLGGLVDTVLVPFSKSAAGQGYRLSPERLGQQFPIGAETEARVAQGLIPRGDRSTIPLMEGREKLPIKGTGARGEVVVDDVIDALSNRAARKGYIEPGDYSPKAMATIAKTIADEVYHHVTTSGKSAIGWYDATLKKAKSAYQRIFPELASDPQRNMLFDAILGITSQGADVHTNSINAVRLYNLVRDGKMTLPQAVERLTGTLGKETAAVEQNLLKLDELLSRNGYERMSGLFNQTKTVGEWNKIFRNDKSLYVNGKPFQIKGGKNQKVTGWMVFGPKIGSFINNLHGDYSTLTADLWFTRSWNRILGNSFIHDAGTEAAQFREFRDALKAEYAKTHDIRDPAMRALYSPSPVTYAQKTARGKLTGEPWEFGTDVANMTPEEFNAVLNDPDAMLRMAYDLEQTYRKGGYKDKSDLRRRAKNWVEGRENAQADPRSDLERSFQQDTIEQTQKLLKKRGLDISVADIQAALWYYEKELFGKYGVASEKAAPADYFDAAQNTLKRVDDGTLYDNKADIPKKPKPTAAEKRAVKQGFTTEAYRGSNRDIQEYGPRASATGYYGGKPTYFTSSTEDATGYTRVPLEEFDVSPYDQLKVLQETNPEATLQDVLSGKYPGLTEEYVNRQIGGENLGAVYPSKLRMQNPVKVGGEGETVFSGEQAVNLVKSAAEVFAASDIPQDTSIAVLSKLDDMAQAGQFGAMDFDLAVRKAAQSADKRSAAKIGGILADIYQKAGFDSIDLDASVFSDRRAGSYSYNAPAGSRHYMVFDPENIRGRFAKFGGQGPEGPAYMKAMGGAVDDEDIDNALRLARAMGGRAGYAEAGSVPVLMEDAKGNKYDAQGNIIPPTNPGPNPARSIMTPEQVGRQAAQDPATYDALLKRYAIPDRDIAEYEALRTAVGQQPQDIQQMTHVGDRPRREMTINMPLFGGEYSMGTAPYDVAEGLQGMAQGAYDFKTMPAYFFPPTAPFALGTDILESRLADDPTGFVLNAALTPQGASAAKSAVDLARRNSKATAAALGTGAYLAPSEAEAGPERWFSKLFRAAEALPMEKMTGEQALAMLRKTAPQEEIKWTGLEGFAAQNPQTTKQALLDYLKRNQVQTQDVVLGGAKPTRRDEVKPSEAAFAPYKARWDELVAKNNEITQQALLPPSQRRVSGDELMAERNDIQYEMDQIHDKAVAATIEEMGGLGRAPKYQSYSTPGGEGYRETLITLPVKEDVYEYQVYGAFPRTFKTREEAEKYINQLGEINSKPGFESLAASLKQFPPSIEKVIGAQAPVYRSPHWQEPNVIGHIRSQMLTANPPGANRPLKLFNVDENQSDLAQSGRKEGFYNAKAREDWTKKYQENETAIRDAQIALKAENARASGILGPEPKLYGRDFDEYHSRRQELLDNDPGVLAARSRLTSLIDRGRELDASAPPKGGLAEAPYVTSTQGWTDLSIKKALDQALDSGADYFTFTPGEVQAARYDLSKHIGKVQYNPDDGSLLAYDPKGKMVVNESVSDPTELDEYVGKELADKLRGEHALRESSIDDAYEILRDEDVGGWSVSMNGEQAYDNYGDPLVFDSQGEAYEYLSEMKANDLANNPVELAGLDLKTGGEGMIDYYNNIYKKRVEKVVKDLTGKKVQWEVLPAETAEGIVPRLGFRIDDDLREAKFPTFASGGIVNKALELTRDY